MMTFKMCAPPKILSGWWNLGEGHWLGIWNARQRKEKYIEAFGEEIRNEIQVWKIRRKMKKTFACTFRK